MWYAPLHVPQRSVLEPLLFRVYINSLNKASVLDPIVCVDNTNQNIKTFFGAVNYKLQKMREWLRTNKLSL